MNVRRPSYSRTTPCANMLTSRSAIFMKWWSSCKSIYLRLKNKSNAALLSALQKDLMHYAAARLEMSLMTKICSVSRRKKCQQTKSHRSTRWKSGSNGKSTVSGWKRRKIADFLPITSTNERFQRKSGTMLRSPPASRTAIASSSRGSVPSIQCW